MSSFLFLYFLYLLVDCNGFVDTSKWFGAEYTPSNATNSLWWYNYENYTTQIDQELDWMEHILLFNSLRMFLHPLNYQHLPPPKFISYIDDFLSKCDSHGIKAGFVFFGDCSFNTTIQDINSPCPGTPGCSNGCWIASPQSNQRDINNITRFKSYVTDIINAFIDDKRVLFWEIYNEPNEANTGGLNYSYKLRNAAYEWITSINPIQPIFSCWNDNNNSNVVDIHRYDSYFLSWVTNIQMNVNKGAVITEGGARWMPGAADTAQPVEVMNFLTNYKLQQQMSPITAPGIFINWEVMVGNSMSRWFWGIIPYRPEPQIPFTGHLFPDGTPVSYTEVGMMRQYIKDNNETEFVMLETFLPSLDNLTHDYYLTLTESNNKWMKHLDTESSYFVHHYGFLIETQFLPTNKSIFSLNIPLNVIPFNQTIITFYVEINGMNLNLYQDTILMKTFNISTLECGLATNGWNLLRVAIKWNWNKVNDNLLNLNSTVSVYLNQMVQNPKQKRIDYNNNSIPINIKNVADITDIIMDSISLQQMFDNILIDYVSVLPDNVF